MEKIIEVKNLVKAYGKHQAVKDISFYVERGTLFSFLGPNGAGKSTTINILCTLLNYNSGEIMIDGNVLGKDDNAIHNIIGVVFQENFLDALLTVRENLEFRAGFYYKDKKQIKQAIKAVTKTTGLESFIDRPYGKLSGGQKRRADIARALIHKPKILVLDEPTTGLDPKTRKNVWDMIEKLQREVGMTIFLTTHYMEEAANSDYVVVINHGEIVAKGTPLELKEDYTKDVIHLTFIPEHKEKLVQIFQANNIAFTETTERLSISLDNTMQAFPILEASKPYIKGFEVINSNMDDVFLNIIGDNQ